MVDVATAEGEFYSQQIKPILDNRCVVCHACNDAPCQLKLSSPEGIDRGYTNQPFYDSTRLKPAMPTRLFEDAQSTQEWRTKGFSPVLNERQQSAEANILSGLLFRAIQLKRENPLPQTDILPSNYDFSLNRTAICPGIENFSRYADDHPDWGMPFGLPELSNSEYEKMERWLVGGAKMNKPAALNDAQQQMVETWESFLNQDSNKHKLMSRYVYEHLFLEHLYFDEQADGTFFTLVRSSTPPGQAVERITTRRPYDDPGVWHVYYRLIQEKATIIDKTHIPYLMDKARIKRWQELFIDTDFEIKTLPGYEPGSTENPFITYQDLPVKVRNQFLVDDAQVFIMGFIKGSVCRGQVALSVIDDRFWVFFIDPEAFDEKLNEAFYKGQANHLRMPDEQNSLASIFSWEKYAKLQKEYFNAKTFAIDALTEKKPSLLNLNIIWDGKGHNSNAVLTVFRHFDNASVVKGLVGKPPKTAWIVDYAQFERIHYLLVAGYDPFGNLSHQLMTRLYMDFLRIEGEFNFVAFLPPENRLEVLNYWYRDAHQIIQKYVIDMPGDAFFPTGIDYQTTDYKLELYQQLQQHLAPVMPHNYDLSASGADEADLLALERLGDISGKATSFLPEVVFIRLTDSKASEHFYTLIHNRGFSNVTSLFSDKKYRLPDEDDLSIVNGFIGSYPNVFWDLQSDELNDLVRRVGMLASEADYKDLLDHYGVRRTSEQFWAFSDRLHDEYRKMTTVDAGLFDYNRFENR